MSENVTAHHRHHGPVTGWKFGVGLEHDGLIVGVAIAGRPVSRVTQSKEPQTIEVTRVCTVGNKNAPSMLYGAISRAAFALGYTKVVTFTLPEESGTSLRAAGSVRTGKTDGGSWNRPSRKRIDNHPLQGKIKWQWEA